MVWFAAEIDNSSFSIMMGGDKPGPQVFAGSFALHPSRIRHSARFNEAMRVESIID